MRIAENETARYTIPEASREARCSQRSIRDAIKRGTLKAAKPFGRYLIRRADLERFLLSAPRGFHE